MPNFAAVPYVVIMPEYSTSTDFNSTIEFQGQ